MDSRGRLRAVGVSLSTLLFVLVGASAVDAGSTCTVTVSPKSGTAGTVFTFEGKGFTPTQLVLHKGNAEAGTHSLSPKDDPWTLSVRSRPGDEGQWSAQFVSSQCTVATPFTVTLSNTDAATDALATQPRQSVPMPIGLIVLGLGAGSGLFLGRRILLAAADNR